MQNKKFGKIGEEITCKYLTKNKYKIIKRNFFYHGGEIDIIALDEENQELVFIEVKTRANKKYGLPSEAVDCRKIKNILKGINYFLFLYNVENICMRVDTIELYYNNIKDKFYINHIKQIF